MPTTRVAAVTRGVRDPNKEVGQSNHMGVFQYLPDDGGWMYINPPDGYMKIDLHLILGEGWGFKSEMKFYCLLVQGPTRPTKNNTGLLNTYKSMKESQCGNVNDLRKWIELPKFASSEKVWKDLESIGNELGGTHRHQWQTMMVTDCLMWIQESTLTTQGDHPSIIAGREIAYQMSYQNKILDLPLTVNPLGGKSRAQYNAEYGTKR